MSWNRWEGLNLHPAGPDARSGSSLNDNGMVEAGGIEPALFLLVKQTSSPDG